MMGGIVPNRIRRFFNVGGRGMSSQTMSIEEAVALLVIEEPLPFPPEYLACPEGYGALTGREMGRRYMNVSDRVANSVEKINALCLAWAHLYRTASYGDTNEGIDNAFGKIQDVVNGQMTRSEKKKIIPVLQETFKGAHPKWRLPLKAFLTEKRNPWLPAYVR